MHITCTVMMCDQQDGGESMHCACPKYVYDHDMRIMHNMCMCMIAAGLNVKTWLHAMSLFDALTLSLFPTAHFNNPILLQELVFQENERKEMFQVHQRRQGSLVAKMCSQNSCFRLKSFPSYSFLGETHL